MPRNGSGSYDPQLVWLGDPITPADFPRFNIHPLLVAGSFHAIIGPYKEGKSFAALETSVAIAYKHPFFGQSRYPIDVDGKVLYLAGEGAIETRMRFEAVRRDRGLAGNRIAIWQEPFDFRDPQHCDALVSIIRREGFIAFVVDTASRCGAGDESNLDMPVFVNGVTGVQRATSTTCLLIHHTPDGDKNKSRGHSSLPAAFDGEWTMRKDYKAGTFHLRSKFSRWSATDNQELASFKVEAYPLGENVDGRACAPGIVKLEPDAVVERREKVLAGTLAGKTRATLATELGCAGSTVQAEVNALRRTGLLPPEPKKGNGKMEGKLSGS